MPVLSLALFEIAQLLFAVWTVNCLCQLSRVPRQSSQGLTWMQAEVCHNDDSWNAYQSGSSLWFSIFLKILFIERGEGREKGRETSVCGHLSCGPHWEPGLQPRHVPWLGIQGATLPYAALTQSSELHQPGLIFNFICFLTAKSWLWWHYILFLFSELDKFQIDFETL